MTAMEMKKYKEIFDIVRKKIDTMMERIDPEKPLEPRGHSQNGRYTDRFETFFQPGWTYSFFLGNVILLYLYTGEKRYLDYLKRCAGPYTDFLFDNEAEIGHDTGFLYSLYAVPMYRMTGDKLYRTLALKAADEVAKRFRFAPGHIQAFFDLRVRGRQDEISLMIADDMMNMNILMWAYAETGHSFYRDVYQSHIAVSVKSLIRDDFSTRHAFHFDVRTGEPLGEMNYCGYAIGSHWTRGTAWVIYGLTKALLRTGDSEHYRFALEGVLKQYLNCLDASAVPLWDFRTDEENPLRDSSAAAIIASAVLDFDKLPLNARLKEHAAAYAARVVDTLCSGEYFASEDKEYIIDYGNGEGTLWGDYFFTELMMKYCLADKLPDMWG